MTDTNVTRQRRLATSAIALVLAIWTLDAAHAERWIQASPTDASVWYDADSVRPTSEHLIGVWVSTGPHRTNLQASGTTSYPTYSIIDCNRRAAGPKIQMDLGKGLEPYLPNSGMGGLIEKLCP